MGLERVLVSVGREKNEQIGPLIDTVADVAGPSDATVELFHVFDQDGLDETANQLDYEAPAEANADELAGRLDSVRTMERELHDRGLAVETSGTTGAVSEQVVDRAAETDANLVFVADRKRSPAGKAVFGSVVQDVMLDAPCPVTFVRLGEHGN